MSLWIIQGPYTVQAQRYFSYRAEILAILNQDDNASLFLNTDATGELDMSRDFSNDGSVYWNRIRALRVSMMPSRVLSPYRETNSGWYLYWAFATVPNGIACSGIKGATYDLTKTILGGIVADDESGPGHLRIASKGTLSGDALSLQIDGKLYKE